MAKRAALVLVLLSQSSLALAMTALSESDLAAVSGQDGLAVSLDSSGLSAQALRWQLDAGQGGLQARTLTMTPAPGESTVRADMTLDVGSNGIDPRVALTASVSPSRWHLQRLELLDDPSRSFGELALVAPLEFRLANQGIFFDDGASERAALFLAMNNARLFYRQNWFFHANLTLDNFNFIWDMPVGVVGLTAEGLRVAGDVDFTLNFDLLYKFSADQDLATVTANDKRMVNFGWQGRLYDAEVKVRAGGIWDGSEVAGEIDQSTRSEGVNIGLRWNYKSNPGDAVKPGDLRWQIGRAGGNRAGLEFGDWRNLQDANGVPTEFGFDFPSITFDAVPAGAGAGGLCWGAGTHGSACSAAGGKLLAFDVGRIDGFAPEVNRTDGSAMLLAIRDGNLSAYSNQVTVSANGMTPRTFNWGLIYTLANIDGNIAIHPGGSESDVAGGSRSQGMIADVLLMSQSLDSSQQQGFNWQRGTHFMIADTCSELSASCPRGEVNLGIGLLSANFLLAADDMRIWLKNAWNGTGFPNNYEGGIDLFSRRARMQLSGLFGGARLPRGQDIVRGANIDMNLEGLANFRLSPPPDGEHFLAYSAALRLYDISDQPGSVLASGAGSFFSIAEPGRPEVDLRFANMQGDFALTEGRLDILAEDERAPGAPPELMISNTILIGASAAARMNDAVLGGSLPGGAAGQVLSSDVFFGANRLGSIVIPNGSLRSSISLQPQ